MLLSFTLLKLERVMKKENCFIDVIKDGRGYNENKEMHKIQYICGWNVSGDNK